MKNSDLKQTVRNYWEEKACGIDVATAEEFSKEYFEQIEEFRYSREEDIFAFAQFSRFNGKKVLEVGVGVGTDFLQWVRAGAEAYALDLTEKGIEHVMKRLSTYGLKAKELRVADAEHIPYSDNYFDLVYSWGVIHHTPNMEKALSEIIRVTRPGGTCKLMIYNRHSFHCFNLWIKYALLKGRPFRSLSWLLYNCYESLGTKGYTKREIKKLIAKYPVKLVQLKARTQGFEIAEDSAINSVGIKHKVLRFSYRFLIFLFGFDKFGFYMTIELQKYE